MGIVYVPEEAILVLFGLMIFQSLAVGGSLAQQSGITDPIETPDSVLDVKGAVGFLEGIVSLGIATLSLLFQLVTFSTMPGLPIWLRIPLAGYSSIITGLLSIQLAGTAAQALPFT